MTFDVLIKGGRIYDGSGFPSYLGDVGVSGGRVVDVGRLNGSARRTINADGLAVAPGFIDFHTHLDAQLLWDPIATSSCWHGVTTVIPGNCGLALAPCRPEDRDNLLGTFVRVEAMPFPLLKKTVSWEWTTFPEYLDRLRGRLGVNTASLMGHCRSSGSPLPIAGVIRISTSGFLKERRHRCQKGCLLIHCVTPGCSTTVSR